MFSIPMATCLTACVSEEHIDVPYDELAEQIKNGSLKLQIGKVFKLDDIVEAHKTMEENRAGGKIVVLT
jgi:NADPH:quinone reductase-like Zn-dependent oxidoreductase